MGKRRWVVQFIRCAFWVETWCQTCGWVYGGNDLEKVKNMGYGTFTFGSKSGSGQFYANFFIVILLEHLGWLWKGNKKMQGLE